MNPRGAWTAGPPGADGAGDGWHHLAVDVLPVHARRLETLHLRLEHGGTARYADLAAMARWSPELRDLRLEFIATEWLPRRRAIRSADLAILLALRRLQTFHWTVVATPMPVITDHGDVCNRLYALHPALMDCDLFEQEVDGGGN